MGGRGSYFSGESRDYKLREFDTVDFAREGMIKVLKKRDSVKNLHFPLYSNKPNTTYFILDERKDQLISTIGIYRNHRLKESIDLTDTRGIHWHEWKREIRRDNEVLIKLHKDNFNLKSSHKRLLKHAKEWEMKQNEK